MSHKKLTGSLQPDLRHRTHGPIEGGNLSFVYLFRRQLASAARIRERQRSISNEGKARGLGLECSAARPRARLIPRYSTPEDLLFTESVGMTIIVS